MGMLFKPDNISLKKVPTVFKYTVPEDSHRSHLVWSLKD